MTKYKRIVSLLLVAVMVLSLLPSIAMVTSAASGYDRGYGGGFSAENTRAQRHDARTEFLQRRHRPGAGNDLRPALKFLHTLTSFSKPVFPNPRKSCDNFSF